MVENISTLKEKIDDLKQESIEVLANHNVEQITAEVLERYVKDSERNCVKVQELLEIEHKIVGRVEKLIFDKELECSLLT